MPLVAFIRPALLVALHRDAFGVVDVLQLYTLEFLLNYFCVPSPLKILLGLQK
jgi:hypothetical protein